MSDIIKIKVSDTPKIPDSRLGDLIVLGLDRQTNDNAHADMIQLRGNTAYAEWAAKNPGKTYADWIALLQEPALTAATNANTAAANAIAATTQANTAKDSANTAAQNANEKAAAANSAAGNATSAAQGAGQATDAANTAAQNANTKANEAQTAANNANAKATLAQEAATNANTKATLAQAAATNANEKAQLASTAADKANIAAENVKDGKTPQFAIGTVEKTAPGDDPVVTLTDKGEDEQGNPKRAINITLPTGDTGPVPVIEIGTVTNIAPGGNPSATLVENGVTAEGVKKYKLNLVLVKGDAGAGNVDITNSGDLIKDTPYILTPDANGSQQYTAQEAVIGGRNLRSKYNDPSLFEGLNGSILTKSVVSVPEWNAADANRIQSSGGTHVIKAYQHLSTPRPLGEKRVSSVYVKNNSETSTVVVHGNDNTLGLAIKLLPGESRLCVFRYVSGGMSNQQVQFWAESIGQGIDVTWWRIMYEEGHIPSMPVPAPEDKEDKINTPNGSLPYKNGSGVWEGRTVDVATSGNSIPIRTVTGQIRVANAINGNEAATLQQLTDHNTGVTAHTDIRNKIDTSISAHNASETAHTDIRDKVDTVEAIARGKARARVFDTVAELDAFLAIPANVAELQVGDNFYIRAVDVPDYWWDGTKKLALEGEKVDLTNLLTIEDAALIYAKQTIFRATILIAGDWVADEDRFKTTISDAAIVDGTKVIITPASQADLDKMTDAGFSPLPETSVGSVTIYAQYQPTENININYSISF